MPFSGTNCENAFVHGYTVVVSSCAVDRQVYADFTRVSVFSNPDGSSESSVEVSLHPGRIESGKFLRNSSLKCCSLYLPYSFQLDSEENDADPDSPEDEPDFYTEAPLPG